MERGEEPKGEGKNRDALKIISAQWTFLPGLGPTRPFIPAFSAPQLPVMGTKKATHWRLLLPFFWNPPGHFAVCYQLSFNHIRAQSSNISVDSPLNSLKGRCDSEKERWVEKFVNMKETAWAKAEKNRNHEGKSKEHVD